MKIFDMHSWLLDSTLATMLPEESNILQFHEAVGLYKLEFNKGVHHGENNEECF